MPLVLDYIDPKRTAVIVVDMQNDFVSPDGALETPMGRDILPSLKRLLEHARKTGMRVIYTTHVHRRDGSDMGLYGEIWPPIASRAGLVDGEPGIEIYDEIAPAENEPVIKKHRYSGFMGTDLDMILRTERIETVAVTGVTTENCCHATARDAMFNGYKVAFISDATGTFDYPDIGFGAIPAAEVHRVSLGILGVSTAHVMNVDEFIQRSAANRPEGDLDAAE
ncbi:MAG: cysteine hydrolase [Defluviicoccus sp.]|nr:cysteine hydrolase [Defluviicoccus sp.]MDE0386418.1 cysteine hydrolase [Defluviicoccus sp.]